MDDVTLITSREMSRDLRVGAAGEATREKKQRMNFRVGSTEGATREIVRARQALG